MAVSEQELKDGEELLNRYFRKYKYLFLFKKLWVMCHDVRFINGEEYSLRFMYDHKEKLIELNQNSFIDTIRNIITFLEIKKEI